MTTAGKEWIDCVLLCLQEHIERNISENADCESARSSAITSHSACYVGCGICSLPPGDHNRIVSTIDSEDLDWWQAVETLGKCATLPSGPPTRGFQLNCVMGAGGCPQTRPAGIPTAEEITAYNEQCRKGTGYPGDDVTPSDEDCERFFGESRSSAENPDAGI